MADTAHATPPAATSALLWRTRHSAVVVSNEIHADPAPPGHATTPLARLDCSGLLEAAIAAPIHLSTAYGHPGLGRSTGYDYTRTANPTRDILQDALAQLEGGTAGLALSSGMAALELTVLTLAPHGSRIVALQDLYGGPSATWRYSMRRAPTRSSSSPGSRGCAQP